MFAQMCRVLATPNSIYSRVITRCSANHAISGKHSSDQMEYIKSVIQNKVDNWTEVKNKVLQTPGSFNQKNVDGVLLKLLVNINKTDAAQSFADHLMNSGQQLNIGTINGMLHLYYRLGKQNKLSDREKNFILEIHKKLCDKYKVLDSTTCERLLHALCAIDEWEKAMKLLDDIYVSCNPTHSAYSTLIATLFRINKITEAFNLIERSIQNQRPLQYVAYEEWINYILRNYKDKKTISKNLEEICLHVAKNFIVLPGLSSGALKTAFESVGWTAKITKIRKQSGQCISCKESIDCLKLSEDEFQLIQKNVKDQIIVGSDLFLKTSPEELKRFCDFVKETAPYDVVLDALNISYAVGKHSNDRSSFLLFVVERFRQENKKILLLGRKHIMKWPRMKYILSKTSYFFTENLSQDDPYFITATILSGPNTDFVSKDLLRGHRFQLQNEQLRHLFQRWQWQHQWKLFIDRNGSPVLQPPLAVTPCAQKNNNNWHIPFERVDASSFGQVRDGTPDWSSWLCLQPPAIDNK